MGRPPALDRVWVWEVVVAEGVEVVKGVVVEVLIWVAVDVVGGEPEVDGDADGVCVERVEVSDELCSEEVEVVSEPVIAVEVAGLDGPMLW
jgi:hypothetical protein